MSYFRLGFIKSFGLLGKLTVDKDIVRKYQGSKNVTVTSSFGAYSAARGEQRVNLSNFAKRSNFFNLKQTRCLPNKVYFLSFPYQPKNIENVSILQLSIRQNY